MNPNNNQGAGLSEPNNNLAAAHPQAQKENSVLQVTLQQLQKVMQQYASDPFLEVKEIERLKAAYLSAEFGHNIKVDS